MDNKTELTLKLIPLLLAAFFCIGWADSLEQLKATPGRPSSVSAEFSQEKHMKILSRPLVSTGKFYYQSPGSLRWEYQSPIRSILLVHNGEAKRYIQKEGGMTEDTGPQLQTMGMVLQEISRYLNGRFDDNPSFSARMEPGRRVVLTPKEASLSQLIAHIDLDLSDQVGLINAVTIYESQDSFTKMTFHNAVLDQKIPETLFRNIQ
jgi:outer membrane lipoprotein-sorting protein